MRSGGGEGAAPRSVHPRQPREMRIGHPLPRSAQLPADQPSAEAQLPATPPTRPLPASAGQKAARVVNPAASRKGLRGIPCTREAAASRLRMEPRPRTRSGQQRRGPNVVPSQQPVWGGGVRRGSPGTSPGQVTPTPSVSESPAPLQHLLSSCSKESRKTFQPRPPHPLSSPEGSKGNHEGLQPRPALNGGRGEAAKLFPPYPHPVSFCRGSFRSLRQVQPLSIPVCRSPPPDPPVARLIFPKRPHVAHTHTVYKCIHKRLGTRSHEAGCRPEAQPPGQSGASCPHPSSRHSATPDCSPSGGLCASQPLQINFRDTAKGKLSPLSLSSLAISFFC